MAKSNPGRGASAAPLATATNAAAPAGRRAEAVRRCVGDILKGGAAFDSILALLTNPAEPTEVRAAALQALQAAGFATATFEPLESRFMTALRTLSDDPDPELRGRVLGILTRAQDRPTQTRLLAGLENPEQALVEPEKALQLLSYDVHAGASDAARKVVADPPNDEARLQALRVLAADATAVPMLTKLLRDKAETSEVRQLCAVALQGMAPRKLQNYAREIVLDAGEDKDLKALSLTALTHFGDAAKIAADEPLLARVEELKAEAGGKAKKVAAQFLRKYIG